MTKMNFALAGKHSFYHQNMRAYPLVFGYRIVHEYQSLLSKLEPRIWRGSRVSENYLPARYILH
jgi:hypothetical protein